MKAVNYLLEVSFDDICRVWPCVLLQQEDQTSFIESALLNSLAGSIQLGRVTVRTNYLVREK